MASLSPQKLVVVAAPALVVVLGLVWLRRRRALGKAATSDPGGSNHNPSPDCQSPSHKVSPTTPLSSELLVQVDERDPSLDEHHTLLEQSVKDTLENPKFQTHIENISTVEPESDTQNSHTELNELYEAVVTSDLFTDIVPSREELDQEEVEESVLKAELTLNCETQLEISVLPVNNCVEDFKDKILKEFLNIESNSILEEPMLVIDSIKVEGADNGIVKEDSLLGAETDHISEESGCSLTIDQSTDEEVVTEENSAESKGDTDQSDIGFEEETVFPKGFKLSVPLTPANSPAERPAVQPSVPDLEKVSTLLKTVPMLELETKVDQLDPPTGRELSCPRESEEEQLSSTEERVVDISDKPRSLNTIKDINMEKQVLEEKLANLVLDTMKIDDSNKHNSERDSANQSPSEIMLASPSISNFSDAHSEGSSDSGKGHSELATSPSRTPACGSSLAGDSAFSVYEFVIPQVMVGRLIGRHGSFIHEIRTSTHTNIFIKRHPDTNKLKICAVEGTQADIDKALVKIRQKFPLRRFPKLTLEKVSFVSLNNPPPLKPEDFYLTLVEGVNNDVIISSLISAAHFFLQQPSHPTYQALSRLNHVMNHLYSNSDAPTLDSPVKDAICAAPTMGGWYRAQIVSVSEDNLKCDVRFVDYGGYLTLDSSLLRQIRGDLLMLPFQAVECYLANIIPTDEEGWSEEARLVVQSLTHGQLLQAQIYDYAEDGTPLVYLYSAIGSQIVLINEELVSRGFATLITTDATAEE